jgi:hypothetical protein
VIIRSVIVYKKGVRPVTVCQERGTLRVKVRPMTVRKGEVTAGTVHKRSSVAGLKSGGSVR